MGGVAGKTTRVSELSLGFCGMAEQQSGGKKAKNPAEVRAKRDQVLARYQSFKEAARIRREQLEGARKFQQFRRDADELESWITEKIHILSDEAYKERTNLQVRSRRKGPQAPGRRVSVA